MITTALNLTVPKRYCSTFTQTDLDTTCRVQRIDRLVVTGQHTGAEITTAASLL